jgi:hypothetical protein
MLHRVVWQIITVISEESAASIFRIEEYIKLQIHVPLDSNIRSRTVLSDEIKV